MASPQRRLAVVVLAGALPWTVVTFNGGWYPVFSFGFLHLDPFSFTSLPAYVSRVGTVPPRLTAWPMATLLYVAALATALFDYVSSLDARIPAGLLFLAGVDVGLLALSLSRQPTILAFPVGALWLWAAVWVGYGDALLGD
ncbi:TIGR04206 family protein [Halobacterium noricense]|uniref:TIGR04206 family protein n=1 Tax=Halobacterium noricense TaxID=223182 RepID=UPI001E3D55BF|nr:TIGR04206 family protein [Halobacterium noricense]UHH26723.1 TIGR04206 family protein [Halobacterium noricense]